jgi:uncharacterized protein (TIGR03435 family)
MFIRSVLLGVLAAAAVSAQTPRLEFEVASVKPSSDQVPQRLNIGVHIDGAQVHINYYSLRDYIRTAFRLKDYQIVGADWLGGVRFDLDAKLPEGSSRPQVPEMLQAMLADRFELTTHRGTKDLPVYALVVTPGGPKLQETPPDPDAPTVTDPNAPRNVTATAAGGRSGGTVNLGNGSYYSLGFERFEARKLTMAVFTESVSRFLDRPVFDRTELKGNYDFTIQLTPQDYRAMMVRAGMSMNIALDASDLKALEGANDASLHRGLAALGLKLEQRKSPIETLVIDHALRTPTGN